MFSQRAVCLAVATCLAGCAMTPQRFEQTRLSMTDTAICKALRNAYRADDKLLMDATYTEAYERRSLTVERCRELIDAEAKAAANAAVVLLGIIAIGAIAAGARGGGARGVSPGIPNASSFNSLATTDFEWDWDEFYNEYMQLVWACRGVQTGQFADPSLCQHLVKIDIRWPSKSASF